MGLFFFFFPLLAESRGKFQGFSNLVASRTKDIIEILKGRLGQDYTKY